MKPAVLSITVLACLLQFVSSTTTSTASPTTRLTTTNSPTTTTTEATTEPEPVPSTPQSCEEGTEYLNVSTGLCVTCDEAISNCLQCELDGTCLACDIPYYLHRNECVEDCPSGYRRSEGTNLTCLESVPVCRLTDGDLWAVCVFVPIFGTLLVAGVIVGVIFLIKKRLTSNPPDPPKGPRRPSVMPPPDLYQANSPSDTRVARPLPHPLDNDRPTTTKAATMNNNSAPNLDDHLASHSHTAPRPTQTSAQTSAAAGKPRPDYVNLSAVSQPNLATSSQSLHQPPPPASKSATERKMSDPSGPRSPTQRKLSVPLNSPVSLPGDSNPPPPSATGHTQAPHSYINLQNLKNNTQSPGVKGHDYINIGNKPKQQAARGKTPADTRPESVVQGHSNVAFEDDGQVIYTNG